VVDLLGGDLLGGPEPTPPAAPASAAAPQAAGLDDLLGGLDLAAPTAAAAGAIAVAAAAPASADPFDLLGSAPAASVAAAVPVAPPGQTQLLGGEKGKGMTVWGSLVRRAGHPVYLLTIHNGSAVAVDGFMLQVNNNSFGLAPTNQVRDLAREPLAGKPLD